MNIYEAQCANYKPQVEGDDTECINYQLKHSAPYGSCLYCQNYKTAVPIKTVETT